MAENQTNETTRLLRAWTNGEPAAFDQLAPRVYRELRRIAGRCIQNERPGRTLEATALVHEAWLRLIDVHDVDWQHRAHFFAVSAQIMRRILLDAARKRGAAKRGGQTPRVNLEDIPDLSQNRGEELLALDEALTRLAEIDPRKAQVVELRFFGGLNAEETAAVLKISSRTVLHDWSLARAWLLVQMSGASALV
jgi:RNA polymerase sigma factor (TIGR02999 family)